MPELILYMGKIGSGKSTHYEKNFKDTHTRINQDEQGKNGHLRAFEEALLRGESIVVDRQNHIREQRERYLKPAIEAGYTTRIIEFKVHRSLCEKRVLNRQGHPTIGRQSPIRAILAMYDRQYQGVIAGEVDVHEVIKQSYHAPIQDLTHLTGKILVIGDPHGCFDECMEAINAHEPDHVVFCGDLNDRGPKIREMVEYVRNTPNVYTVEGNHENKMIRWLRGNKVGLSGGLATTASQFEDYTEEQRLDLYNWMMTLPVMIKLPKDYVVVHAGVRPDRPLERQPYDTCLYIRNHGGKHMDDPSFPRWYEYEPCEELSKYHMLFGHAIHEKGKVSEWATSLDMGAVYGTGLRALLIDAEQESKDVDTIHEQTTPMYYESKIPERHPFYKKEKLVEEKFLSKSEYENLVLYNYTDKCTFERMWVDATIESRGTIYDKTDGRLVAKGFPKFFNLNEHETTMVDNLPWDKPFKVFEKMDGSLGLLYRHKGEYKVSTRGSFFSDQAKRATQMLEKYDLSYLEEKGHKYSLLFEIIYPSNKIVVEYGDREELVLLGGYKNKKGEELSWDKLTKIAKKCGFALPKVYDYTLDDMLRLKDEIDWDKDEGWVVHFHEGTRCKIKGTKYLEMAKILSHMSPLAFWEAMCEGRADEYLISIPEEIREQAEEIYETLTVQHKTLCLHAETKAQELDLHNVDQEDKEAIKSAAERIKSAPDWMRGYLFQTMRQKLDNKNLLRLIRPTENIYVDIHKVMK